MKKVLLVFLALVLTAIGFAIVTRGNGVNFDANISPSGGDPASVKDATYTIEGTSVTLHNGVAVEDAVPGSATKITTRYFGNEAVGDLNGDGIDDEALLLTQDSGGSGTFYYVVAALKTATGYQGTNGISIGDRIAPQSTSIDNDTITVNYADREPSQAMSEQPTVGKTFTASIVGGVLKAN